MNKTIKGSAMDALFQCIAGLVILGVNWLLYRKVLKDVFKEV